MHKHTLTNRLVDCRRAFQSGWLLLNGYYLFVAICFVIDEKETMKIFAQMKNKRDFSTSSIFAQFIYIYLRLTDARGKSLIH